VRSIQVAATSGCQNKAKSPRWAHERAPVAPAYGPLTRRTILFQVAGGDYVETETRTENEREKEATEGSRGDGDRLHPVLEEGRGSMLQAVSATVYGLLDPTHDVWSVRRVTIFASFGVVLAAAATAGMLLFRTLLCGTC